ncbi:uncharacterized protein Z519_03376 [Cladophialophora bantiana CBS 173.52]|uniref:Prostaglandin-endoperoxide synthase 1 n=1 Tax=Cladophialophora bantiana (strain ATCC 10958 / CBS 173.52 / CDC B-1940 / NIH 8579) TaxID=1442370 RepID=A0A0D2GCZ9_CLAB1|nr:uncharacterized protein Z519_03376 [Cladophialophora bantiana CBS 173.52]KIW96307.1 hypothetical protein Z519_03376 [Cladophialophora bantiana CBS 173.52]
MPLTLSRLKGLLCIPENPEDHSKAAGSKSVKESQPNKKPIIQERPRSSDSNSSSSTSETKRSDQILDVLKNFNLKNLRTVKDVALQQIDGEPIDDKTYLMERIIQLAANLPVSSRTSATLTNAFLNQLWTDLKHPPQSYLGSDYIYRKADGCNNNILWPHLGAAKQPYARTVRPRLMQPVARPDPGVIFDSLLARKKFRPHPNKISSVLFYVASIIIHDIFHTNHEDYSISDTSSYLDLAPLYGSSVKEQEAVRTMCDGKLKPDCFSDVRILGFPPGVGVLLILFNRFHNHVAENLARIDENGRFSRILNPQGKPKPANAEKLYDEALFQTARLITTGLYVNIILKDYVRTILNLNRVDSLWNLDPRSEEGNAIFGHKIPEATGNSVSAEFNLVYRWHSCVSERDEQWTKDAYTKLFGHQSSLSMGQFLSALTEWAKKLNPDPVEREFAGLQRQPDNKYPDQDLAAIWTASVSDIAGSYGAAHVPAILKNVEVLGIIQSRSWNLASLNEFREYFKLEPHKTFEDINPDPVVVDQLRRLYGHPDNVEIYPGIVVEAAKEPMLPGSGLCTNFTTSRAILSDAVALVRGDRFYTIDYTPNNLTNWGFKQADYDLAINYGCVFYKLVLTALPNSYRQNSVYAHYPLVIPEENKSILTKLKKADLYNFDKPTHLPHTLALSSVEACKMVMRGTSDFRSPWDVLPFSLVQGLQQSREWGSIVADKLLQIEELQAATDAFYKDAISALLRNRAYQLAGSHQVDVVRDVFNVAHAQFAANLFFLPLGDKGRSHDKYDEQDVIALLSAIYSCANVEQPARRFALVQQKQKAVLQLAGRLQDEVGSGIKGNFSLHSHSPVQLRSLAAQAIQEVSKSGLSPAEIVWSQLLPLAAFVFVNQSRVFAEVLDHVLGEGDKKTDVGELKQLLDQEGSLSGKAQSYLREVCRTRPSTPIFRQATSSHTVVDGEEQFKISAGQRILCDTTGVNRNSSGLPDAAPGQANEALAAFGGEISLGAQLSLASLGSTLSILCELEKLDRAVGPTGQLRRLNEGAVVNYLNVEESMVQSYPASMMINWEG